MTKRSAKNQSPPLAGKTAVITGASRGIGLAIAEALAAQGCMVIMVARSVARLRSAQKNISAKGGNAVALACDVSREKSVIDLFRAIKNKFRKLDILVNNAGVAGALAPVEKTTLTRWREIMATNVEGTFLCTRAALPLMQRGATIVNNLSIAAKQAFPEMAAYVASKHAALGLTNVLRQELRERGIRVLALLPGATDTDIWQQFWPEAPKAKMISPASVAAAVVQAMLLPPEATIEELSIGPVSGSL